MTDLLRNGDLLPVATVAEHVTGQRPSRPTIWRWLRQGVSGGITLDAVPIYGQWHTTQAAFRHFLRQRSEAMRQPRDTGPSTDDDLRTQGFL